MAIERTAGIDLPQALRRRPRLKVRWTDNIDFGYGHTLEARMQLIFPESLNLLPSPFDPQRIGLLGQIERVSKAPPGAVPKNLARIVGRLRWVRDFENSGEAVKLSWKGDCHFMETGRDSHTNIPMIGAALKAGLLDVHIH